MVGVRLDINLDKVKAPFNKILLLNTSPVQIKSRAMLTKLMRDFMKCKSTKKLLISLGLMIEITHYRCEVSRSAKFSFFSLQRRDNVILCYQWKRVGHKTNDCSKETQCLKCDGSHKLVVWTVPRRTSKFVNCPGDHEGLRGSQNVQWRHSQRPFRSPLSSKGNDLPCSRSQLVQFNEKVLTERYRTIWNLGILKTFKT